MTKQMKRFNLRLPPEDYARIMSAARKAGLSTNRYIVAGALAYDGGSKQIERIESAVSDAVDRRFEAHTELVGEALSRVLEQQAEQDQALRTAIKSALGKVLDRIGKGARK